MSETKEIKKVDQKKPKKPKTKAEKRLRNQRIVAGFLIFCLSIGIVGTGGVLILANSANKNNPDMTEEDFFRKESTKLLDNDGDVFFETGYKIVQNINYEQLPQSMVDALISIEDSRFFDHDGVDVPRFAKAMLTNGLDTLKYRRLMFSQGGSTLTMQLIKNTYFTYENHESNEVVEAASSGLDGVKRKFQELTLARQLEREEIITKKETIALYLNTANFGAQDNIVGIQNSAEKYFNKNVEDLSLVESAFLAGVLNAPESYTPYNSIRKAKERTNTVLYQMMNHGYITKDEYEVALSVDLENLFVPIDRSTEEAHPYQAFIDVVLDEVGTLVKDGGEPVEAVDGGMIIHTSMSKSIQEGIDKFQRREIEYMDQGVDTHIQVGSAIVNNSTGEIVGIVGGYDYKGMRILNNATIGNMQPASVVKPLLDYALAFEYLGWASTHVVVDSPYQYAGTNFLVGNYDGRYLGEISLMHAVGDSRNPTALKALQGVLDIIGNEGVIEYLRNMGFQQFKDENFGIGFAIGGGGFDTSPLELAGAYAGLMNGGDYIKPHTITRIEFTNGKEPIVNSPSAVDAVSDAASFLAAETMKYAVSGPYPGYLESLRRHYPVYGKTGTNRWTEQSASAAGVDAPSNAQKNRLMVAATSEFTTATWVGFVKHDPELKPWITSSEAEFNLTGKLSSYLLDLIEEEYGTPGAIPRPGSIADITHILGTFPYQVPLPNMNPELISSGGMIKRDFLKLVEAKPQPLESLSESKVSAVDKNGTVEVTISMSPYPDLKKLTVAENSLVMPLPGGGSVTGARIYDDSWVFGAVRYKSEILINGEVASEIMNDNPTHSHSVRAGFNDKVQACAYYTYDLSLTQKSNVICSDIKISESSMSVPRFTGGPISTLVDFARSNGLKDITINYVPTDSLSDHNKITKVAPNIDNSKKTLSELRELNITADVKAYEYTLGGNITASKFVSMFGEYFTFTNFNDENKDKQLTGFSFGDGPLNSFKLNDVLGRNIQVTLIFE